MKIKSDNSAADAAAAAADYDDNGDKSEFKLEKHKVVKIAADFKDIAA